MNGCDIPNLHYTGRFSGIPFQPYEISHPARPAMIPTVRKKPFLLLHRTMITPKNPGNSQTIQPLSSQLVKICPPFALDPRTKCLYRPRIVCQESGPHLFPHFERFRPDRGPHPYQKLRRVHRQRVDRRLDHASCHATPTSMCRCHNPFMPMTEQEWHAVGRQYDAGNACLPRPAGIGLPVQVMVADDAVSMNLMQPTRQHVDVRQHPSAILCHMRGIISTAIPQVEAGPLSHTDATLAAGG